MGSGFQLIRSHFDCGVLVDEAERNDESQSVVLAHQSSLNTLHGTALDANLLANHNFEKRADTFVAEVGAEKLNLCLGNWRRSVSVPNNSDHPWALKDC